MTKTTHITPILALLVALAIFMLFGGGSMEAGSGNSEVLAFGFLPQRTWLWLLGSLIVGLVGYLGWSVFAKKTE
jgi:hypothetical protein